MYDFGLARGKSSTLRLLQDDVRAQLAMAVAQAEASPDGMLVVSPDGKMVATNRRFAELWGFPEAVIETRDDEVAIEAALARVADPQDFVATVRYVYAERVACRDQVLLADGRVLDRYGAPLYDPDGDGEYLGYAWYFRDVTEQMRTQAELRELAITLQASLLPPRPPEVPGMEVATRYRPADRNVAVGGDFYDVFRLGTNEWGLVIGDVCGKGAAAAALTALTRYTLRAAAVHHPEPSAVLQELNAAVLAEPEADGRFCSVVYGRLELDRCGAWVTLASGGHPRPIVVRRAGWLDVRGHAGSLIGLFDDPLLSDDLVGLGPGDALVLCTDGITEARRPDGQMFGEERLHTLLLDSAGEQAETMAGRLVQECLAFAGGTAHDDVAVLVVRVPDDATQNPSLRLLQATGSAEDTISLRHRPREEQEGVRGRRPLPPREARIKLPVHPSSSGKARRFVSGVLRSWRMPEITGGAIELLTSELTTNAVRHARSSFTVVVRYSGDRVRIEVDDSSPLAPEPRIPSDEDPGGRGLILVEALAEEWGVTSLPVGKRVWFEVLVPPPPD
ncbi:MAG TPA: SpoIIE family protein phosphatase [Acidimicrobiales bacterium]|nr:SpoIIE family protein phosphatase [Acidimicrobiales bacterium]